MSQKTVQLMIGRLLTDEDLRLQFVERPRETLADLRDQGFELTNDESDALARFYLRLAELKESAKILQQALSIMPAGPVNANETKRVLPKKERVYTRMEELIYDFMLINLGIDPPVGEVYQAVESSKGELGFTIVSDGTGHPWRMKIRSPSMCNLQALPVMLKGGMISDIVAVIGSVDPVMGEADK